MGARLYLFVVFGLPISSHYAVAVDAIIKVASATHTGVIKHPNLFAPTFVPNFLRYVDWCRWAYDDRWADNNRRNINRRAWADVAVRRTDVAVRRTDVAVRRTAVVLRVGHWRQSQQYQQNQKNWQTPGHVSHDKTPAGKGEK